MSKAKVSLMAAASVAALAASAAPRPFTSLFYGAHTGEMAPFKGMAVFEEAIPVYSVAEDMHQKLRPFTKHNEYRKKYVQRIPDKKRRKTPYNVTDILPDVVRAKLEEYSKGGRPFFVYERISRPPYFLPSDGCPLADRAAFAEWKRAHPGFMGFNSLWELDSDTTYFTRFWDKIEDEALKRDLQAGFEPPRERGRGHLISWIREMFRRARDFHWGERRIWPMCSNHMGFEHLFAANGATGLWYEATTQSWGAWNCAGAFLRGARRQWSLPCGWYMAQYYTGFTRGGEFKKGDSRWYDPKQPEAIVDAVGDRRHRGEGRSQHRRQALYGWLIGADYMQTEGWQAMYKDWKDGRVVPSENAVDFNEIYMLSKTVDRGDPYTPLAVLTPLAEPSATNCRNDDLLEPETQKTIFNTLVPMVSEFDPSRAPDRKRGQQGCLFNSEFPGFFDALCPDAGQDSAAFEKALRRYRHVLIAGDSFDREKFDSRAIAAFEKGGGRVHRYPSPGCDTPDALRRLLTAIRDETMPFSVEGDVQWGVNKVRGNKEEGKSDGWLVYLINNKGVIKFCDEPEEYDLSKTARVAVTHKATGETRTVEIRPGDFRLLEFSSDVVK